MPRLRRRTGEGERERRQVGARPTPPLRKPTLSVCVVTRGPPGRVRALLELVRPAADEIVLAVDQAGDRSTLDVSADLADRRFVVEVGAPDRVMGWLHRQCGGDWILRLDDDEAPSRALLAGLPELLDNRAPPSMPMPRRWLYPAGDRYITSHPWTPDYQFRLVRNLPSILDFPGLRHENILVPTEQRFVDLPIYHLDLLLTSPEERRAKAERYERDRPGHHNEGFGVNDMYTPEDYDWVETAPVPRPDRRLIGKVLEGEGGDGGRARSGEPVFASADEIDRFWRFREVSDDAYRAKVEFVRPVRPLPPSELRHHELVVKNLGDEWWPAGDDPPEIRMGYRWLDADGGELDLHGPRTHFTEIVAPGQTTRVLLATTTPPEEGEYILEADVVHEHERWFGVPARTRVTVRADADPLV
jgi:hypothetical protein